MAMPEWLENMIGFLNGFRKLTVMLLLILLGIGFRLSNHISGAELVDLLRYTSIAFFSSNGIEHMTGAVKEWLQNRDSK